MNLRTLSACTLMAVSFVVTSATAGTTHTPFKKVLQDQYPSAKITCATCHVEGESRTERNELGKLFYERLEEKELSRQYAEARKRGTDARREFDKVLAEEFLSALRKLERSRDENGWTYRSRFLRGEFSGL